MSQEEENKRTPANVASVVQYLLESGLFYTLNAWSGELWVQGRISEATLKWVNECEKVTIALYDIGPFKKAQVIVKGIEVKIILTP